MSDQPKSARVIIEVVAGLIPQQPMDEYTKRFVITSDEWNAALEAPEDRAAEILAERNGQAIGYASWLMLQPNRLNWVRTDWIWL